MEYYSGVLISFFVRKSSTDLLDSDIAYNSKRFDWFHYLVMTEILFYVCSHSTRTKIQSIKVLRNEFNVENREAQSAYYKEMYDK